MYTFQHGIRRAILRAVGACLGLSNEEEEDLPTQRGGDAVNTDLQPAIKGQYNDGEGLLLLSRGDEEDAAVNNLHKYDGTLPPQRGDDQADEEGHLPPQPSAEDDGSYPPSQRGAHDEENPQLSEDGGFLPPHARGEEQGITLAEAAIPILFKQFSEVKVRQHITFPGCLPTLSSPCNIMWSRWRNCTQSDIILVYKSDGQILFCWLVMFKMVEQFEFANLARFDGEFGFNSDVARLIPTPCPRVKMKAKLLDVRHHKCFLDPGIDAQAAALEWQQCVSLLKCNGIIRDADQLSAQSLSPCVPHLFFVGDGLEPKMCKACSTVEDANNMVSCDECQESFSPLLKGRHGGKAQGKPPWTNAECNLEDSSPRSMLKSMLFSGLEADWIVKTPTKLFFSQKREDFCDTEISNMRQLVPMNQEPVFNIPDTMNIQESDIQTGHAVSDHMDEPLWLDVSDWQGKHKKLENQVLHYGRTQTKSYIHVQPSVCARRVEKSEALAPLQTQLKVDTVQKRTHAACTGSAEADEQPTEKFLLVLISLDGLFQMVIFLPRLRGRNGEQARGKYEERLQVTGSNIMQMKIYFDLILYTNKDILDPG